MGALYISDDFQPVGVEAFFNKVLKPFYEQNIKTDALAQHPTKVLFELFQSRGCLRFEMVKEDDEGEPGSVKSQSPSFTPELDMRQYLTLCFSHIP